MTTTTRPESARQQSGKRVPVQIQPDVYDAIRALALADDRPVARYINRVLREHIERERSRPT